MCAHIRAAEKGNTPSRSPDKHATTLSAAIHALIFSKKLCYCAASQKYQLVVMTFTSFHKNEFGYKQFSSNIRYLTSLPPFYSY